MSKWWGVAFGVVGGLLGAGLLLLVIRPPRGEAIHLLPPPTPLPLSVHVSGAVLHPGVYSLPDGCRVHEAVQAAGGLLPEADPGPVNLAAFVQDGERIWIPSKITPTETKEAAPLRLRAGETTSPGGEELPEPAESPSWPVNINTASQADLESLPGIGPVIAQRIITFRQENGPFTRIEELQDVSGIGPATYAKVKDLITVAGP
ncbi:MAG TPA: helix-hairpin-helix domain-containing protein [Anaerolineales bacterium]